MQLTGWGFTRCPLFVKPKTWAQCIQIKWTELKFNALHLSLVWPFALTPLRSQGHSWAAPAGVLNAACQTERALGSAAMSLPASPTLWNSPTAKNSREVEGKTIWNPESLTPGSTSSSQRVDSEMQDSLLISLFLSGLQCELTFRIILYNYSARGAMGIKVQHFCAESFI